MQLGKVQLVGDQVAVALLEGGQDGSLLGRVVAIGDGFRETPADGGVVEEFVELPPTGALVRFRRAVLNHRICLRDGIFILYHHDIEVVE